MTGKQFNRWLSNYNLRPHQVPIWLVGLAVAALWFMPFLWMVSTSFKYPADVMTTDIEWIPHRVTLQNYVDVFTNYPILRWIFNSLFVVVVSTALTIITGAMAGYALARMTFPGRNILFFLYVASLMVPTEVYAVPLLFAMIKVGWADTYQGLILPSIGNVFAVLIFRQFFLRFPGELEDAARIDGASVYRIFWSIAMPLARAPLIAATVIVFVQNFNNFLWPLLITFSDEMKTLPVGLAALTPVSGTNTQLESFGTAMAGVTLLSLPSIVLFLVLQRYFITGISRGGIRG